MADRNATNDVKVGNAPGVVITIKGAELYQPVIVDGVRWETERKGAPGRLSFTVIKDDKLNFQEGNEVNLFVDGTRLFFGYVFTKSRDKDGTIKVVAYDQLRYLKNKFVYQYSGTATSLIKAIADDFFLRVGDLEDTKFSIPPRLEDNVTLFDAIQNALDLTFDNTKEQYVLYDDAGKITLKALGSMKLDVVIEADTAENFNYSSSIDGQTYNSVQLYYEDGQNNKVRHMPAPARDSAHVAEWGLLQLVKKVANPASVENMQKTLLKAYNRKTRTLRVVNAFGDIRVRAGSLVPVLLDLGDVVNSSYLLVERCEHNFENGHHSMTLDLIGGDFVGK